ncbi:hypothetical protein V1508DRAFT_395324 [Lipomyces doorenjongii]|uniref:uncharacterized protein n=1 Tax=Lipomyces doorenjongii TaxID=383834 RepID=UPI0034CD44F3
MKVREYGSYNKDSGTDKLFIGLFVDNIVLLGKDRKALGALKDFMYPAVAAQGTAMVKLADFKKVEAHVKKIEAETALKDKELQWQRRRWNWHRRRLTFNAWSWHFWQHKVKQINFGLFQRRD